MRHAAARRPDTFNTPQMKLEILPSLLGAYFGALESEIKRAAAAGADALHIDIMDPHFVPNISFGPDFVALARDVAPALHRNVHLMMSRPDLFLESFAKAGAQTLQIHVEADCDISETIGRIAALGMRPALVVNPDTGVEALEPYLDSVDEILVMTVRPGYGGQKFISGCLEKAKWLRARRPSIDIMVDGGINGVTASQAIAAGVNQLVSGSYLFAQADMAAEIARLKALAADAPSLSQP